jgi:hypothetical protein
MAFRHPRNIIQDPKDVDLQRKAAEELTVAFLRGQLDEAEYYRRIDEMREYLDFRRLAAEVPTARPAPQPAQ